MQAIRKSEGYRNSIRLSATALFEWDRLANKTILITGASGMLGTYLIDVLMFRNLEYHDNIHIIAVSRNYNKAMERLGIYWDREEFHYIEHDVIKPIPRHKLPDKIDYIIHGASNTHPVLYSSDPIGTIDANVFGTKNLLDLTDANPKCRFIFLSSVEIYGENRGDTELFSEEYCGYIDCNTLRASYTESKRLGEAMCQAYLSVKHTDVVIPRLCRVYGPTMLPSDSKAISQFIKNSVAGKDIILKSSGKQKYSFIYVADAISAILTIMLRGKSGQAYNVADENSNYSLIEIAQILADFSGRKLIYELPEESEKKGYSIATKAMLNSEKLKALGWSCEFMMEDGLKCTYEILKYQTRN